MPSLETDFMILVLVIYVTRGNFTALVTAPYQFFNNEYISF